MKRSIVSANCGTKAFLSLKVCCKRSIVSANCSMLAEFEKHFAEEACSELYLCCSAPPTVFCRPSVLRAVHCRTVILQLHTTILCRPRWVLHFWASWQSGHLLHIFTFEWNAVCKVWMTHRPCTLHCEPTQNYKRNLHLAHRLYTVQILTRYITILFSTVMCLEQVPREM